MTQDQQLKLLLGTVEVVKALAESEQKGSVVIMEQRETIQGLLNTGQRTTQILNMLLNLIEEQRTAINDLRRRIDEDELPPFDRTRFSIN